MDKPRRGDKVFCPGRSGIYLGGTNFGVVQRIVWDTDDVVIAFNDGTEEEISLYAFDGTFNHRCDWWQIHDYDYPFEGWEKGPAHGNPRRTNDGRSTEDRDGSVKALPDFCTGIYESEVRF